MRKVAVTGFWATCTNGDGWARHWSARHASVEGHVFPFFPSPHSSVGNYKDVRLGLLQAGLVAQPSGTPILHASRTAVCVGVSKADFSSWPESGVNSYDFPPFADHQAHRLAAVIQASGPVLCPVSACATGSHALILGARLIESGEADVAVCGAYEPMQSEFLRAAYRNMGALSKSGLMRPFDVRRDGFVPGWGGGYVFLESLDHAQQRGAIIHALLSGYSMRSDASHMTSMSPSGDSIVRAIDEALAKANHPTIGYINAHGTATRLNDESEARALNRVFGARVPVSSTKPLTGHLLGASGAVEAVISVVAMQNQCLPPTIGLEEPEFDLDFVREERRVEVESVLSLNYGFGGHIGALIVERVA
jgi:3-oxoacyl-[acyl-carrier-protein] synthase II